MKMKMLLIFILLFPLTLNFSTTSSYACSCAQPGAPMDELAISDYVFSGKVKAIIDPNKGSMVKSSADLLEVQFEVMDTWKGVNETEVIVFTERDSASCGFNFNINEDYLVYAQNNNGEKKVSLCSRTAQLTNASADLTELGVGEKPTKVGVLDDKKDEQTPIDIPILLFTILVILLIFTSYIVVQKKMKQ